MNDSMPTPPPNRADTLLGAALDLPPQDREAYLVAACGQDAALLAEVRELLAAYKSMPADFLAASADDLATIRVTQPAPAAMPDDLQTLIVSKPVVSPTQTAPDTPSLMGANPAAPVPFVFGRRIAQGGMGAILEASDCKLGRTIAVKIMLSEAGVSAEQKLRFIQEAAVLARLAHPNIVPVYDLGLDAEGELFYTMKLVKGRTLQHILDELRHEHPEDLREFTLDRLLTIFRKVCDALAFAHAQKIIHRDLKPENIMVGEFGEVLVMDWGIAKILDGSADISSTPTNPAEPARSSTASLTATMDGAVMGTPNYMSPEQAMGKVNEMDARSDIFSLGGILYAILTLRPPVEGKDVWEVLEKVQMANITAPTTFGATTGTGKPKAKGEVLEAKQIKPLPHVPAGRVPNALSAVAMKALTLDKTKRYQNIAAFSADIEAYQGGFATSAENAGAWTQVKLLIKRNKGIFSTAAAAWLLISGLALWFIFNLRAKEQRATKAEAVAVQEKETARQALAKSQLDLAEKEFERGKFVEAQKIIEDTPESFRDANWRFLSAHSCDFTAQFSIPRKGSAHRLLFLPQGDRFAARCFVDVIGIFTLTGRQIGDWFPVSGKSSDTFGIDSAGGRIAFMASANEIAVHELATGKLVRRWNCGLEMMSHVLLSPDGGTVLAAGAKQLIAYATQTGAPLWTQPFTGVLPAFSPDGRTVAIFAGRAELALKLQLLDTLTGAVRAKPEATADNPTKTTLQFNQAGDRLACLGGDELIFWDTQTARKIRALHFPGETVKLLSPGGDVVATISGIRIRLWDTASGKLLRSLNGASTGVLDLAFSSDGKMLLSSHAGGGSGIVNVWPTRLGEEIASAHISTSLGRRVLFDRDASGFYASAKPGAAAWEIRSGLQRWKFSAEAISLNDLAIHPTDGTIILTEHGKNTFTHVSSTGEALKAFGDGFEPSLKFNRSGQLLLAVDAAFNASDPGYAFSVLEYPSGKVLRKINFKKRGQPFAAFCLDEAAVATAALAGGITVWDWKAGTPLHQVAAAQTGSIGCLASSPDGRHLASGGPDRWIRVWEAETGRLEAAFRAHWESVCCLKFSPDGREILSGSDDGTVRLHDAATGEERLAFYGLTEKVADVDISADGKLIAAITTDGFTKVWDRQISSAAALLPKKPKPAVAKDADGWEDLIAQLTPAKVEQTEQGWNLKDGELFSPEKWFTTLPLPSDLSDTRYQVRVKLRQVAAKEKESFNLLLPVANRRVGFNLDGFPKAGYCTGLIAVNGKRGNALPGVIEGKQINDSESHVLEVTVRLDGANATITTTLDTHPLYTWTGPVAFLSQDEKWVIAEPGTLALGTVAGGWAVSEVRVKRLEK